MIYLIDLSFHPSPLDVHEHFQTHKRNKSKESILKIPLVGWMMKMSGDVSLVRGDRSSGAAALKVCETWLDRKMSVMIFPEGTRSLDGEIRAFKDGAFRLAITTGTPILPMAVHGTRTALRKHDWRMGDTNAEVRVLPPISTEGMTEAEIPELRERVRDLIVAEVAKMSAAA